MKPPALIAATVLLMLTACSSSGSGPSATATVTTTATATETVTATPTIPTGAKPARTGKEVHGEYVAATVLEVDPDTPVDAGIEDQERWYSALVKVCAIVNEDEKGKPIEVSWAAWNVARGAGEAPGQVGVRDDVAADGDHLGSHPIA